VIIYKEMDATSVNQGVIAHGVNCQHKMASGIAKTVREKWPQVYDCYMRNPGGPDMLGVAHIICVDHETDLHQTATLKCSMVTAAVSMLTQRQSNRACGSLLTMPMPIEICQSSCRALVVVLVV
jgi:hypothetical protein